MYGRSNLYTGAHECPHVTTELRRMVKELVYRSRALLQIEEVAEYPQKAMQRQAQTATAPAHCSLTAHKLRSIRAFLTLRRLEVLISNQNLPLRRWACAHHFHRIAIGDSGRRAHAMCVQTMHAHAHEQAHARAHAHAHEQVHAGN